MQTRKIRKHCQNGSRVNELTFKVFGTLTLLARLADDFDRTAREYSDNAFRLIVRSGSSDLDECLDFFLLVVNIGNKELLADTTSNVGCP